MNYFLRYYGNKSVEKLYFGSAKAIDTIERKKKCLKFSLSGIKTVPQGFTQSW